MPSYEGNETQISFFFFFFHLFASADLCRYTRPCNFFHSFPFNKHLGSANSNFMCECNKIERTYFILKSKWTFVAAIFFFFFGVLLRTCDYTAVYN